MIEKVSKLDSYFKLSFIVLIMTIFMPLYGFSYMLMIGACLGLMLIYSSINQVDLSFLGYSKSSLIFFIIYLIYPFITFFWVESYGYFWSQMRFTILHVMIYFISYFFLIKIFPNQRLFLKIIIGIGVIYIIVSLWELATGSHLHLSRYHNMPIPIPIPTGFYYNENNQTIITSMILPYASYFFLTSKKLYQQFFYISIILMFIIIAAVAGARISMIISIPFLAFVLIKKRSFKLIGLIFISLLLLYSYVSIYRSKDLKLATVYLKYQYESITQEVNSYNIGSTQIRINMIKNAVNYFGESHYMGVGAGNYDYLTKQGNFSEVDWIENTHSYFFELLANYGIIVTIAFILLLIGLFKNILLIYRRETGDLKLLAQMNMLQIPVFFIVGFIPSSFFPIFQVWFFIGYLSAFIYVNRVNQTNA